MMVNLMRSNQRWLMIVVSALVLISFLYYFSASSRIDRTGASDRAGTIYGRPVSITELQRTDRQWRAAYELGLTHVVAPELQESARSENDVLINQLVMQHQAQAFGILPTDEEADEAAQALPVFRGANGQFDPEVKNTFVADHLNWRGMTEAQVLELVKRDLQYAKLRQVLDAAVFVTPQEVRTTFEQFFCHTEASVVRFKAADLPPTPEPTDDDIKKAYDAGNGQYQQPEKRKVQYVRFALDDAQKKLTGRERMDVLKPLSDQAVAFLEKLNEAKGKEDFAALAQASGLAVKETGEFEEQDSAGLPEASIAGFAAAAFKLSPQDPDSPVPLRSPLQNSDAFYVQHLSGVTPSRPLTLDEARPKIVAALKEENTRAAVTAHAEEVRTKIAEALKAGKSFADAAKDAGAAAQDLPGFALAEPPPTNAPADLAVLEQATTELAVGDLSKFLPSADGGALAYVRGRSGVNEAQFDARKDVIALQLRRQKQKASFEEWLRASKQAADPRVLVQMRG